MRFGCIRKNSMQTNNGPGFFRGRERMILS